MAISPVRTTLAAFHPVPELAVATATAVATTKPVITEHVAEEHSARASLVMIFSTISSAVMTGAASVAASVVVWSAMLVVREIMICAAVLRNADSLIATADPMLSVVLQPYSLAVSSEHHLEKTTAAKKPIIVTKKASAYRVSVLEKPSAETVLLVQAMPTIAAAERLRNVQCKTFCLEQIRTPSAAYSLDEMVATLVFLMLMALRQGMTMTLFVVMLALYATTARAALTMLVQLVARTRIVAVMLRYALAADAARLLRSHATLILIAAVDQIMRNAKEVRVIQNAASRITKLVVNKMVTVAKTTANARILIQVPESAFAGQSRPKTKLARIQRRRYRMKLVKRHESSWTIQSIFSTII